MASPIGRRDALRWGALAGGGAAMAAWLAACAGSDSSGAAATSGGPGPSTAGASTSSTSPPPSVSAAPPSTIAASTTTEATTSPIDPSRPWWMQGDFAPVADEVESFDLVVQGAIPPELTGVYVRNGSNPAHGDSPHWFFGDGMVHGVRLESGRATWYRNRYVSTDLYRGGLGFGQGAPGGAANQSNVSAIWHGGRLLTSGEVGLPYELDPSTLATIGPYDFDGALTSAFTAHPKIDPVTGRMHSFGYGFTAPYLTYHVTEADGTLVHSEVVDIPRSTMMHDFAITESDVVFWDLPVVFDLQAAIAYIDDPATAGFPYRWTPDAGARVGVMPLGGPGGSIQWFDLDPCYAFHGVNAFRRGDEVVIDICRLSSMFDGDAPLGGDLSLRRWTVDTAGAGRTVHDDVIEDQRPGELPSRDPRRVGREHRYGYFVDSIANPDTAQFAGLIKHDYRSDSRVRWEPAASEHAGEWLFVPVGDDEDAGWLLTFSHDDSTGTSDLLIIDATAVAAGPVARVTMPARVPYGFHATWIPG